MTKEEILAKYPDVGIITGPGEDAYREGEPIVERDPLTVIIKPPSEETYLIAYWANGWRGFLTGGVEGNDTIEDTVRREVLEETGYSNVESIMPTDRVTRSLFYHPFKKVNRLAHYRLVIAKLADLAQEPIAPEELAIAEFNWVAKDKVSNLLTTKEMRALWEFYLSSAA